MAILLSRSSRVIATAVWWIVALALVNSSSAVTLSVGLSGMRSPSPPAVPGEVGGGLSAAACGGAAGGAGAAAGCGSLSTIFDGTEHDDRTRSVTGATMLFFQQLHRWICAESGLAFGQCILEKSSPSKPFSWVHVSLGTKREALVYDGAGKYTPWRPK